MEILGAVFVLVDQGGEVGHGGDGGGGHFWIQLAEAFEQKWIWIYYMNLFIYIYIYTHKAN